MIVFIAAGISITLEGYDISFAHGSVTIRVLEEFHILVECMVRRDKAFNFCDMCLQRPSGVRGRDEDGVDAPQRKITFIKGRLCRFISSSF